jgi:PAT family beta-lactamase induction signal transducer AmpG
MSSLTSAGFTATQYALFSSLYALPGRLIASQSGRMVEYAAQSAAAGGPFSVLTGFFTNLPPESFATAMERSGVSPAALAAGYSVFFIYSTLIGMFAIVLAFMVAAKERRPQADASMPALQVPSPANRSDSRS